MLLAERQMIKKLGMEVDEAVNGEIALRAMRAQNGKGHAKKQYSLILMDINMPVMNGYIASQRISELVRLGEVAAVPIVCLSAQDSSEHKKRCGEAGIVEMGKKRLKIW